MRSLWTTIVLAALACADSSITTSGTNTATIVTLSGSVDPFSLDGLTGSLTYPSVTTTMTVSATSAPAISAATTVSNSGNVTSAYTTTSGSVTLLVGSNGVTTIAPNATIARNRTMSASSTTSSSPLPTNTQPCNGYTQFCTRKYSNVTYVAAHNSPFVKEGNFAANQQYPVKTQLDDGIRMLQFQVHLQNGSMLLCHTSCELLNVGTLQSYLTTVTQWLNQNPYEVITILMGNYDLVDVGNFTAPLINSGITKYAYQPPKIPMALDDWPLLSELILTQKRVVLFMDYNANQTQVPYILDEFSQMWETPFSPTDSSFPCTEQRPPNLSRESAEKMLYMANHNLNVEVTLAGQDLLIPNTVVLNETNAVTGYRSLGLMANNCLASWGRPPNFLLVDYYNKGSSPGSVFEVAAEMNNVTYNGQCCGLTTSGSARLEAMGHLSWLYGLAILSVLFWA